MVASVGQIIKRTRSDREAIKKAREKQQKRCLKRLGLVAPIRQLKSMGLVDDAEYGAGLRSDPEILSYIRLRIRSRES